MLLRTVCRTHRADRLARVRFQAEKAAGMRLGPARRTGRGRRSTRARTVDATELTAEELTAWLGSLNDFRLVLGTTLGVTENDLQSEDPEHALYHYLSYLEESVVNALAGW